MDPVVLSYFDSLIRESDLLTLSEGAWLNDSVINLCLDYYQQDRFAALQDRVCFISPDVSQLIKLAASVDEVRSVLEPLGLQKKEVLIIPVNDQSDPNAAGGNHWTLLVYSREKSSYFYFDSFGKWSLPHAARIATRLVKSIPEIVIQQPLAVVPCPQQNNTSDCGVFMLMFIEVLCTDMIQHCGHFDETSVTALPCTPSQKRRDIRNLIDTLSAQRPTGCT